MIEIYCDGSYRRSEDCGGFGICVLVPDQKYPNDFRIDYTYNKQEYNTTNNQMELKALIYAIDLALHKYKNNKCIIYCDSAYCVNMCKDWIWTWAKNGWKNSRNEQVENIGLVYSLYCSLIEAPFANYQIRKITGHSGNLGNTLADALATNNQVKIAKILKENDITPQRLKDFEIS